MEWRSSPNKASPPLFGVGIGIGIGIESDDDYGDDYG